MKIKNDIYVPKNNDGSLLRPSNPENAKILDAVYRSSIR
jgi:hypothetical protein